MIKILLSLMLSIPTLVNADCQVYDINKYKLAPIFVRGVVVTTTTESQLEGCSPDTPCKYSFSVAVSEVIKGQIRPKRLFFSHGFYGNICPPDLTFNKGEEWIFALSSVDQKGNAKLHGGACGGFGVPTSYENAVKELMGILEIKGTSVNKPILPSADRADKF